mmetsp:Transcript_17912/g.33812  ORF Transcript_17912/g.33812 Transcript_17912/m.33812 type:complete len:139 (+) Transcript_17912:1627-2043(+)|eukprot:scaffold5515_cov159-Amphora_coffeaeformis.AAC.4
MSPLLCPPLEDADKKGRTGGMSSGLKANFETLKKRKLDSASAQKVAEETAHLVESEIQQLRNSVAELEAMLAAREDAEDDEVDSSDEENMDDLPAKNPFPILPPDVVAIPDTGAIGPYDDDSDDELGSSDVENEGEEK